MRLESWERIVVFLIGLFVPAIVVWLWVGADAASVFRVLASLGASSIAVALMFGWSVVKLPALMDAEAEAARKALENGQETAEQRRGRQDRLGGFLERGTALMSMSRDYENPPPEDAANEWFTKLVGYLESELGSAYVARVNDGGSAPVGYMSQHVEHDKLYNGIRIRVFHLQEFLKEMSR